MIGRTTDFIVHSVSPMTAEPRLVRLREAFITPQDLFYVRSHGEVPALGAEHWLRVDGLVATPLELSLPELKARFTHRTVAAVLQCAGNRRGDLQPVRPTSGTPWHPGAIGHAEWTGVRLADVLHSAGMTNHSGLHVAFTAHDSVTVAGQTFDYQTSIGIEKAMSTEVTLAWAMNGESLAPEHGHPLRVIVPGYAGVRSVKWLKAVTVRDSAADSPIQQRDYKMLPPHMTEATVDWAAGLTINDMPLNAAICEPEPGASVPAGAVTVRGYAIANGRPIARVDVSDDGGRNWCQAALEVGGGFWSWTFWSATLHLEPGAHELAVRAWDGAGQTMPSRPDETWNFKGYLCAAWHRVPVTVV